jgi:proteic killer suppression protein
MILSFADQTSEDLFHGENSKAARKVPQTLWAVAVRKLDMLNAAHRLDDLKSPPGNRLEALQGRRRGQHSIRINDQYRIVFVWAETGVRNVQVLDYHS